MTNDKLARVLDNIKRNWEEPNAIENLEKSEKIISVGAGAFIFLKGISNLISHPLLGVAEVAIGGGLLYRGLTGYCPVKEVAEQKEREPIFIRETFIADTAGPL
ncbi:MAG: DUF2892 domain-containing protein [Pedobacter sp.]|nr:MAG: DUF2892 domain-containing protein [Pedobacter sp.]